MTFERFEIPSDYKEIDPAIRQENVSPTALDGWPLRGILYLPPKSEPDVAILAMHPRGDFSRHYVAPHAALAGYAFMGCNTRNLNNDADCMHERILLDMGGAVRFLKERGFKKIILIGNSGGGSFSSFYIEQSSLPAEKRFDRGPSGDRVPLREVEMPTVDGLCLLAAHPGEGKFLLDRLDPSVVDEANPTAVNPRLDMYNPENGYVPLEKGQSKYSADFLAEFRAGQRARCERIDRQALEWAEEAAYFRGKYRSPDFAGMGADEQSRLRRYGLQRRYLLIYRTLSDPRYLDLSIDPSQRPIGSIFAYGGRDPIAGNYGEGLARVMSVRGWLSTWSGLSSRAYLERTLPSVKVPVNIVNTYGDTDIYPAEADRAFELCGSNDKALHQLEWADHYLNPVGEQGAKLDCPRARAWNEFIHPWLKERWPV